MDILVSMVGWQNGGTGEGGSVVLRQFSYGRGFRACSKKYGDDGWVDVDIDSLVFYTLCRG